MGEPVTFADLLRSTREKRGDTVSQLATQTSGSASFIADCESGRRIPTALYARRLAEALRADPFEFEMAIALETGRLEFDPEALPRDAIARALTELRAGGR